MIALMANSSYKTNIDLPKVSLGNTERLSNLKKLLGKNKIVAGLSGGVDSSLTAKLLLEAGWEVQGLTLWIMSGKGSCCTDGIVDAAGICKQLGIPHHIVDARSNFEKNIIQALINGYKEGITPLPCSRCNRFVKFSPMLDWAKENLNVDILATGHYARIKYASQSQKNSNQRHCLLRGRDKNKDQSYFLYDLSQEVLGQIVFPLGELTKTDTRKEANFYELRTANKPESQDLCLAEHHGSMKAFLNNYLPSKKGEIKLRNGLVLGEHDGIQHFTIGQRKGLGIAWKEPLHVVEINSSSNTVIVAPRCESGELECVVGEINWISIPPPRDAQLIEVQIRYRSMPVKAKLTPITPIDQDIKANRPYRAKIEFQEKLFSISPGQAAVFYSGDTVLGGGIIQSNKT